MMRRAFILLIALLAGAHHSAAQGTPEWTEPFPAFRIALADHRHGRFEIAVDQNVPLGRGHGITGQPLRAHVVQVRLGGAVPAIASDYQRMFRILKALPCGIFLGAHGGYFGREAKYARIRSGGPSPFVDPTGYARFVTAKEKEFLAELQKQQAAAPARNARGARRSAG